MRYQTENSIVGSRIEEHHASHVASTKEEPSADGMRSRMPQPPQDKRLDAVIWGGPGLRARGEEELLRAPVGEVKLAEHVFKEQQRRMIHPLPRSVEQSDSCPE